ncbi:MAG: adaptor protein MecA [Lachnospiraceae bacterium]
MKIEKVNENQIRCTLTREDLDNRHLKLSELAYGTEKAKSLFRDMMQQASYQFGFNAEDIPLMIEAVPLSSDSVILIITKVEYPEELDTRFSKFSESGMEEDLFENDFPLTQEQAAERADDILDLFRKIQQENEEASSSKNDSPNFIPLDESIRQKEAQRKQTKQAETTTQKKEANPVQMVRLFVFNNLQNLLQFSSIAHHFYSQPNTLYKNPTNGRYYLLVSNGNASAEDFNRLCNILAEYGASQNLHTATSAYMQEHYEMLIDNHAIETLGSL